MDASGARIAAYVPTQKLEWKRYKQYTNSDIQAAIEAVKSGMSALQASRKFKVPSRTLYDKVRRPFCLRCVVLGFTGFYLVLLGFTGFYWVLPSFTGFYLVLPSFT